MNKQLFPVRALWAACASVCLAATWLPQNVSAQSPASTAARPVAIRSVDFIVAVVNTEPITNQEVQTLSARLQREAQAQGRPLDAPEAKRQALEQLINDKAQIQQARDAGITIDEEALDQAEANVANNNQLTREALRQRLQQDGVALSSFREQLRNQLLLTRVREREVEARIRISDIEVEQFLQEQLKAQAARAPVELNLAMILIAVPENSTEEQIKPLEAQARDVARRARSGENFAELAKSFSQTADRGANGGALGLRPADRYPELFVQAIAAVPVGGVSEVLRSGAGFHVLKVLERQQAPATLMVTQTRARHILLRLGPQLTQAKALAQLSALRQDIVSGKADFAEAARRLSQDGSAAQGGDLGWASPGMFVPEFEQTMNRLRPGQVAEPLVSRFGVHLIEVTDRRDAPMSDAEQRALARNVLREKKIDEAYVAWAEDVRGRAYVEMRESAQ
ncbi:peptidylprolyl isomerase [Limnohabitans sp.]|uniref:peptidylprolyl isomerase n=1 Tax=Limnohabitans sp. TaxID=1907725 RepID=UPI0025C24590|nr:peptidylprolyl isomerase [Limnohabitans sp.]